MKKTVKIFLFSDALGFELVQKYRFMPQEFKFRRALETQFGYSSTAVPTILCGKPPQEHGHFSFFFRANKNASPFRFFKYLNVLLYPRRFFDHHRVRHQISKLLSKLLGYKGYFNLYRVPFERLPDLDYCEKTDIFAPNGLFPVRNIADILKDSTLNYHVSDWREGDEANLTDAEALLNQGEKDFLFIYTAGLDGMLHFNVSNPDEVQKHFDQFATHVRRLLDAANQHYQNVSFYLFSDHGMTPLAGTCDVKNLIESTSLKYGKDYIGCYDSTMFRFYELTKGSFETASEALKQLPGHWLSAEEKHRWGICFADNSYGDEIFLLAPGYQIVPSDMGAKAIPGMHGFSPEDKDSTACILSNIEPAIIPNSIADIFNLMTTEITNLEQTCS